MSVERYDSIVYGADESPAGLEDLLTASDILVGLDPNLHARPNGYAQIKSAIRSLSIIDPDTIDTASPSSLIHFESGGFLRDPTLTASNDILGAAIHTHGFELRHEISPDDYDVFLSIYNGDRVDADIDLDPLRVIQLRKDLDKLPKGVFGQTIALDSLLIALRHVAAAYERDEKQSLEALAEYAAKSALTELGFLASISAGLYSQTEVVVTPTPDRPYRFFLTRNKLLKQPLSSSPLPEQLSTFLPDMELELVRTPRPKTQDGSSFKLTAYSPEDPFHRGALRIAHPFGSPAPSPDAIVAEAIKATEDLIVTDLGGDLIDSLSALDLDEELRTLIEVHNNEEPDERLE